MTTYSRRTALLAILAICLALPPLAQGQDDPLEGEEESVIDAINPLGVGLLREHAPTFTPGTAFEIKVTIYAARAGVITAVGLREIVPTGWQFESVRGFTANGNPPSIMPPVGASGLLEFAWITPPSPPYTFVYTVQIPENSGGHKMIHGQFEYRQGSEAHKVPPVITELEGPDVDPPTVTLQGDANMTVTVGTAYREPGYEANDDMDGDVSNRVKVVGTVYTSQVGEYVLTYYATDFAGNQSLPVRRTVQVVAREDGSTVAGNAVVGGTPRYTAGGSRYRPRSRESRELSKRRASGTPQAATRNGAPVPKAGPPPASNAHPPSALVRDKDSGAAPASGFTLPPYMRKNGAAATAPTIAEKLARDITEQSAPGTSTPPGPAAAAPASTTPRPGGNTPIGQPPSAARNTGRRASGTSAMAALPALETGPGLAVQAQESLAALSTRQIVGLVLVLAVMAAIAAGGLIAWRVAYHRPPRRANGGPPS